MNRISHFLRQRLTLRFDFILNHCITVFFISGFLTTLFFAYKPWYAVPGFVSVQKAGSVITAIPYTSNTLIILSGVIIALLSLTGIVCLILNGNKNRIVVYSAWGILLFTAGFPIMIPVFAVSSNIRGTLFDFELTVVHDFLLAHGVNTYIPWDRTLQPVQYKTINLVDFDSLKNYFEESVDYSNMGVLDFLENIGFNNTFYSYLKNNYFFVLMGAILILLVYYICTREQIMDFLVKDSIFVISFILLIVLLISCVYLPGNYYYYTAGQNQKRGLQTQALIHYTKACTLLPGLKYNFSTQYHIGKIHYNINKFDSGYYWFYKALTNLRTSRLQTALNSIQECVKYMPDNYTALYLVYYICCKQGIERYNAKAYYEAAFLFRKALDSFPVGLTALYNLGLIYTEIENFEQSKKYLQQFNALTKLYVRPSEITHCRIYFLMAWGEFKKNNLKAALSYYRTGLTLPALHVWNNIFTCSEIYSKKIFSSHTSSGHGCD